MDFFVLNTNIQWVVKWQPHGVVIVCIPLVTCCSEAKHCLLTLYGNGKDLITLSKQHVSSVTSGKVVKQSYVIFEYANATLRQYCKPYKAMLEVTCTGVWNILCSQFTKGKNLFYGSLKVQTSTISSDLWKSLLSSGNGSHHLY